MNGHTIASTSTASRVPFLLSYTAADAGNPKDFVQALETLRGHSDRALLQDEVNAWDDSLHPFPMFTPFFAADMLQLDVPQGSLSLLDLLPQSALTSDAHDDALRRRTSDLIAYLEEDGRASSSHDMIAILLTPTNLELCVESFFQYAYRHVPIVHKSSFEIVSAELPLLLSIFVVGAVWSYPRDTYFMVLDIVELTERCIFESDLFKTLQGPDSKYVTASSPGVLSLLQAATMLVSISFAFPNADQRRRFRSQRFFDLMSITRLLKYDSKGGSYSQITDAATHFEWTNYVTCESCNR
ncbi:hypothetical protein BU25DRAFT_60025 [Macroventuria anomochaeta]|uniref:Uncharacterized protein n=1 Tax=Macroventuria anomochaeta TaxID=301207 RepID=A0ACB6S215_9PLEO|nr:uncharacterized protein BU25DRAFT_60025 [Macroventuria anomochaeta]KAF2627249.1 hypothetical protein BU25DRAFT_60025 [Macroventuria anomochaeta]